MQSKPGDTVPLKGASHEIEKCGNRFCSALPKGATEFSPLSEGRYIIVYCPSEGFGTSAETNTLCCVLPKGATEFFPLSEGRHRIVQPPSEGVQPTSKGKMEAGKRKKLLYLRTHSFFRVNIYIRAPLTSQDLSSDTKFSPSQSRETLPLNMARILQHVLCLGFE